MGSSIGPQGSRVTGNLGEFLKLKVGSQVHQGFLTCHHVIAHETPEKHFSMCGGKRVSNISAQRSDCAPRPFVEYSSTELDKRKHPQRYQGVFKDRMADRELAGARTQFLRSHHERTVELVAKSKQDLDQLDDWPKK